MGLQFATKMGLTTTGVDVAPQALELAGSLHTGADIVDASKEAADEVRRRMSWGEDDKSRHLSEIGLDAVLILPNSQKSFNYGIDLVKNGGLVVVLSYPPEGFKICATDLVFRRIRVEGSLIGSNKALRDMFDFCVKHNVRARVKTYPFSELNALVKDIHSSGCAKVVLDMSVKE